MCKTCDWEGCIGAIDAALSDLAGLPEAAADFSGSVEEKLESIRAWVEEHEHVTEAQETAVANMANGIQGWMR